MIRKKITALCVAVILTAGTVLSGCGDSAKSGESNVDSANTEVADSGDSLVVDGGFEAEELSAWKVNNVDDVTDEIEVYKRETDVASGAQCLHFYSEGNVNFTIEQEITGLESGTYSLSCAIQGDNAGDSASEEILYAIIDGETYQVATSLDGYLVWNNPVLEGLEVTGGPIIVGLSVKNAAGGWGTVDDITRTAGFSK